MLEDLSRRQMFAAFLLAGLVAGTAATYVGTGLDSVSADEAGEKVVSTLEQQTGQDLELINVDSRENLYQVDMRTQDNQVVTYYITRDGNRMAPQNSMIDIDQARQVFQAREDFSQCLSERNVVMYGNLSEQETQLQIQVLGGANYVSDIYRDVNDEENLQEARNRGLERIPGFYYEGSIIQGINEISSISELTGCEYSIE